MNEKDQFLVLGEQLEKIIIEVYRSYLMWNLLHIKNKKDLIQRNILTDTLYFNAQENWILWTIKLYDKYTEDIEKKTIWILQIKWMIQEMLQKKYIEKDFKEEYWKKYDEINILLEDKSKIIINLRKLRNKYLCHNDYNFYVNQLKYPWEFNDIYSMLEIARKIYLIIFDTYIWFDLMEKDFELAFNKCTFN